MLADGAWGLPVLIVATVVMSLGLSPVFTLGNEMIITAAPPERAGAASALSETVSEFSGALGIALFGSLGTALYRRRLDIAADVPDALAAQALGTLGGAVAAAAQMPGAPGQALLVSARAAFVDALQLAALVAAGIVFLACIVSARILRGSASSPSLPTPSQEHP